MSEPRQFRQPRFTAPPGATEILLVRHGESAPLIEGSPFPLVDGHGDPPLHPDGVAQAELVADRLVTTGERIAAIYVTTLIRTHQTAAPLAGRLGIEPRVEGDLREVFLGDWEGGLLRKQSADGHPVALQVHAEGRWDPIPNAESEARFSARVRRGIERIAAAHPDELVVAVVHGGVIGAAMNLACGATGFRFTGSANASISHLVIDGERWMIRCFNDTSHLSPTFSAAGEP